MLAGALLLLVSAAEPRVLEVSGDVDVTVSWGARDLVNDKGSADAKEIGDKLVLTSTSAAPAAVSLGTTRLEKIVVKGSARVTLSGFAGKSLDVVAADGGHVKVSGGKTNATDELRIDATGTARVDADGLAVERANVTLKDAARAHIRVSKSLTCDLQRASRLVVKGKPANVDKKIAGVAKLEIK